MRYACGLVLGVTIAAAWVVFGKRAFFHALVWALSRGDR